jgi:preprotein translocase subunit SecG
MFKFFLVVHAIIAASLVGVILMQRSEGGGLAGGGSPSGLMTARGAADFLTRTTTILATLFVGLSIVLATLATINRAPTTIDTSLARKPVSAPAPEVAPSAVPLAGAPAVDAVPAAGTVMPKPDTVRTVVSKPEAREVSKPTVRETPKPADKPAASVRVPAAALPKPELPKVTPPPVDSIPIPAASPPATPPTQ